MYELKIFRGAICHDNEKRRKTGRGLAVSKLRWVLSGALENLKNLHFNGLHLTKVYNVWAKQSIEELCLMALKIDASLDRKLTCAFRNVMKNLGNFHHNTGKSKKWDFDRILLSKVKNVSA